jgi:hypothetical protein
MILKTKEISNSKKDGQPILVVEKTTFCGITIHKRITEVKDGSKIKK